MSHTLKFCCFLLLLLSPSLLRADSEVKIQDGVSVGEDDSYQFLPVVSISLSYQHKVDGKTVTKSTLCGGSVLKPDAILSAYSCLMFYKSKEWNAGSNHNITISYTTSREWPYYEFFDEIKVVNHKSVSDPALNGDNSEQKKIIDMALVFLPKHLTVRFATASTTEADDSNTIVSAGWGADSSSTAYKVQLFQMKAITKQDNLDSCDKKPEYDEGFDPDHYYCFQSLSRPCTGDFGGPVFQKKAADNLNQIGILIPVKDTDYCEDSITNGYFPVLRVEAHNTWIQETLAKYSGSSGLIISPVLLGLSALVSLLIL